MPVQWFEIWDGTAWLDITGDVRTREDTVMGGGRADEAAVTDPGTLTFLLNNRGGRYSPRNPESDLYGLIGRNTPLRMWVRGAAACLLVPETGTSRARVASTTALNVAGDIDVRIELALDALPAQDPTTYAPASQELMARYNTSAARMWRVMMYEDGRISFVWSADGTTAVERLSTDAVPAVSGQRLALRVTLDADNGASGHTVTFYTALSVSGPWTQLGQPVVTSGTTSVYTGATVDLELADISSLTFARGTGCYFAAQVRDGIDGTLVADADFTAQTAGATSFTDGAGRSWLIEGDAEVTDDYRQFYGEISAWPSRWDTSDADAWVEVEAAGILRRYNQGRKALQSTLRRRIPSFGPLGYWPMEEDRGTRRIRRAYSPIEGVPFMTTAGLDWGASDTLAGSAPLPTIAAGSRWDATVPRPSGTTTEWQVEFVYHMPQVPASRRSLFWITGTGTVRLWRILYGPDGSGTFPLAVQVTGEDASGALVVDQLIGLGDNVIDAWLRQRFTAVQNGGSVEWQILWENVGGQAGQFTGTYAGSVGRPIGISSPTEYHQDIAGVALGHLAVFIPQQATAFDGADTGWAGETAVARMRRLAEEEALPISVLGTNADSTPVGPQRLATLLDLLQQAADADGGLLTERRETLGLQYLPRAARRHRTVVLALDYAAGEISPPLDPTDDDQRTRNDITVSAPGGTSARVVQRTGPLSTQPPPDGVGIYDEAITLNLAEDWQLEPAAYWLLHLGTSDELRYPTVTLNMANPRMAPFVDDLLHLQIGDRVTIANPPPWLPPGLIDLVVEGHEQRLNVAGWDVQLTCSPAAPWNTGTVARTTPSATDPPHKVDSDTSQLYAAAGTADMQLYVTTGEGMPWVTSAGPAPTASGTDMPIAITVGGEEMSATAIEPTAWDTFGRSLASTWGTSTSGDTWTETQGAASDRSVNGSAGLITLAAAPDTTRFQYLDGVLADCEVLVSVTPSQLATGSSFLPSVLLRFVDASNFYRMRAVLTTGGAVQLQVTRDTTAIGSTGNLVTYGAGTKLWLRARVDGDRVRGRVWRDSGAEPGGWQIDQTITTSTIATGRAGVTCSAFTGNTNASPAFSFDDFRIVSPQAFTVTRSVNGVSKSHNAGAAVRLATPAIVAL